MGNAHTATSALPRRPYVGCTADAAWQRAGIAEATVFDVYEIGELLGSGTFGQVRLCWPVYDAEEGAKYAVKVVDMKSEVFRQATSFISARQEANILKGIRHSHIVELIDVFEKERFLFLVLGYVTGGELFGALADPRVVVTEGSISTVGRQLFSALSHLHDRNILHRDIKAENILLTANPAKTQSWHIKLIDFGLATRLEQPACLWQMCKDQEMPPEELICGTAYYCAPQVWVNDYTTKVDVWAAGVVLYLALLGTFPFYDSDAGVLESMICNMDKKPLFKAACSQECPNYQISAGARKTLSVLLGKDPEARPSAAGALSLPWLHPPRSLGGKVQPGDSGKALLLGRSVSTGSVCSQSELHSPESIPMPIRLKAARAAARPAVDPNKENARTKELEALKRRAASAERSRRLSSPRSSPSRWQRSPMRQHRELSADRSERRGMLPCGVGAGSSLNAHDAVLTDTSLTESDIDLDDAFQLCTCR